MQFSPRLRDIGDHQLCKRKTDATIYPRLDVRLTGHIDLARLLDRWDDLARVAGSLTRGYVTASLLISRLQAYPRQGQLTKLLQEYQRLIKTLFVLRYLQDQALRRRVHAQLNKGEKLHDGPPGAIRGSRSNGARNNDPRVNGENRGGTRRSSSMPIVDENL
jgi:TnpA family transposase